MRTNSITTGINMVYTTSGTHFGGVCILHSHYPHCYKTIHDHYCYYDYHDQYSCSLRIQYAFIVLF